MVYAVYTTIQQRKNSFQNILFCYVEDGVKMTKSNEWLVILILFEEDVLILFHHQKHEDEDKHVNT